MVNKSENQNKLVMRDLKSETSETLTRGKHILILGFGFDYIEDLWHFIFGML